MDKLMIMWIAAIVVFIVIEAATVGLTSIWFAVGALAALVAEIFGAEFWVQMVCFLIVSIVALIATKPLAKKATSSVATARAANPIKSVRDCSPTALRRESESPNSRSTDCSKKPKARCRRPHQWQK